MSIQKVSGTPLNYYLIAFDAVGNEREESSGKMSQKILDILSSEPITDVFLFSHGWLGDIPAAHSQYDKWVGAMSNNRADIEHINQVRPGFRPLLIGLHWPSLPWGDEEIGGAVSFAATAISPVEQLVEQYAERIANTEKARQALSVIFQAAMEDIAPESLSPEVIEAYEVLNREAGLDCKGEGASPGSDRESFDPESIFQAAESEPVNYGSFDLGKVLAPLRTLSFWTMKDRARQFGESGGFQLLAKLQQATTDSVRFHLMGHSFGCIVVSSILAGPEGHGTLVRPVNSVALVQGALSHWSYCFNIPVASGRTGYFHSIMADRKVNGPIITTQSDWDFAVRDLYPLAAGVRQQISFNPGEFPKIGALGTFGVRGPDLDIVDMKMLPVNESYQFEPGKIYNLESSQYICQIKDNDRGGAHNDIANPGVAHAIWQAALGC